MMRFVFITLCGIVFAADGLYSANRFEVSLGMCFALFALGYATVFAGVLVRRVVVEGDTVFFMTYLRQSWAGRASDLIAICPGELTRFGIRASTWAVTPAGDHVLLADHLDRYADVVEHLRAAAPNVPTICPSPPWWQRLTRVR